MKYNPDIHHRRSIRLKGYDYAQAGAYFVTICTHDRVCVFGDVLDEAMMLNDTGVLVQDEWRKLEQRFSGLVLDTFVVMPNHLHGIVHLVGARFIAPQFVAPQFIAPQCVVPQCVASANVINQGAINQGAMNQGAMNQGAMNQGAIDQGAMNQGAINRAPTVGEIVRAFKAVTARVIRQQIDPAFAWQRNYYEHIIRDETALAKIREYIVNNPKQWALDRENPANQNQQRGI